MLSNHLRRRLNSTCKAESCNISDQRVLTIKGYLLTVNHEFNAFDPDGARLAQQELELA